MSESGESGAAVLAPPGIFKAYDIRGLYGTEMDEMLSLRILTLTDEERENFIEKIGIAENSFRPTSRMHCNVSIGKNAAQFAQSRNRHHRIAVEGAAALLRGDPKSAVAALRRMLGDQLRWEVVRVVGAREHGRGV